MELKQGDVVILSEISPIMSDDDFERLLVGKSSNTTVPTNRKAKAFIVRGLLNRGVERKGLRDNKEIIGGAYRSPQEGVQGRIFLVEGGDKATLLWQGPMGQFPPNYRKFRDELAGKVHYTLHGRAANVQSEINGDSLGVVAPLAYEIPKETTAPPKEERTIPRDLQLTEKQFEDILAKYPEMIEEGLTLRGRQVNVSGKFVDLLFVDKRGDTLIVELKKGTVKREHVAQLLDYEGFFVSEFNPTTRVMLIGNHVPKNLQNSLDHHGIEYTFFSPSALRDYLRLKADGELLSSLGW